MPEKTIANLTHHDIASLADGTGGISDETATRLANLIRSDPRYADLLERLRKMADDAGVKYLADGLEIHQIVTRLRKESWQEPRDVVHPHLDVPYPQLITMTATLAKRARGKEKTELTALEERLIVAFSKELAGEAFFQSLVERLMPVKEGAAEQTLGHLVGHYRRLREERVEKETTNRAARPEKGEQEGGE